MNQKTYIHDFDNYLYLYTIKYQRLNKIELEYKLTVISSIKNNKMTRVEVMVKGTVNGIDHIYWGDEGGTLEFYMVRNTLKVYLGDKFKVYNHPTNDTFILENDDDDEGCDYSYDIIEMIEPIYDNLYSFEGNCYLSFIVNNVE